MKKILFIQHATEFGGSVMSLLYTINAIKENTNDEFEILIALAKWNEKISHFYEDNGIKVVKCDFIETYEHTQSVNFSFLNISQIWNAIKQEYAVIKAKRNSINLLEKIKPDIVHLNSVVLLGSALAVNQLKIPLIWHVREPAAHGLFGIREKRIICYLADLAEKVFFICHADMQSWGNPKNGEVVYNFLDFNKFNKNTAIINSANNIEIPKSDLNILFLGGVSRIKGGIYIIKSLKLLIDKFPDKNIKLIYPGSLYNKPTYLLYRITTKILPLFGFGTYSQLIEKEIIKKNLNDHIIKLPFTKNVSELFRVSDVLIFPSIRPHFARPVIEANAMGIPAIASDLPGVNELILNGYNGYLVKPKNEYEIFLKLSKILTDIDVRKELGKNGYQIALNRYDANKNIVQIIQVYRSVL